jgi:type II secretory pathway pseudopilin PulG
MARPTATGRGRAGRAQAGFSILGLLFLVAGLGVALAALGTAWSTAAQREKERDLLFVGDQYRRAIESFWKIPLPVGTPRRLPKNFDELLEDPRFPTTVRHLRRVWRDPLTGTTEWGLVKEPDGGLSGVYSLDQAQPFKSGNFPPAYEQFGEARSYRDWVFRFDVEKAQREAQQAQRDAQRVSDEAQPDQASASGRSGGKAGRAAARRE